jgi:hypothetical protein
VARGGVLAGRGARPRRIALAAAWLASLAPAAGGAQSWTDWTARTLSSGLTNGSAAGTLTIGGRTIGVAFAGDVTGNTQLGCGTNYWASNSAIYTRPDLGLPNAPRPCDIVSLVGGSGRPVVQTLTFTTPLIDPVFAVLSLGQAGAARTYRFDQDFDRLRSGRGHFGGSTSGSLFDDGPAGGAWVLRGIEGHGLIRFRGAVSSISWTVPNGETWHGFTVGAVSTVPEPATAGLLAVGLVALGAVAARRQNGWSIRALPRRALRTRRCPSGSGSTRRRRT